MYSDAVSCIVNVVYVSNKNIVFRREYKHGQAICMIIIIIIACLASFYSVLNLMYLFGRTKKKILTTKMNLSIRKKGTTVFDNDIQTFYWNLPLTTQQKAYMSKKNSVNSAQSQMYLLTW